MNIAESLEFQQPAFFRALPRLSYTLAQAHSHTHTHPPSRAPLSLSRCPPHPSTMVHGHHHEADKVCIGLCCVCVAPCSVWPCPARPAPSSRLPSLTIKLAQVCLCDTAPSVSRTPSPRFPVVASLCSALIRCGWILRGLRTRLRGIRCSDVGGRCVHLLGGCGRKRSQKTAPNTFCLLDKTSCNDGVPVVGDVV